MKLVISRSWREAARTNLWVIPTGVVVVSIILFALTVRVDHEAAGGRLTLPGWINAESPDTARQILIAIAAAVITVVGVVFSITILVLQLASQQFGPRLLGNFIRDLGTQASLGAFVATFVYSILALEAVTDPPVAFVPHLTVTVAFALTLVDLCVLIYYIDHVASAIQLSSVVYGIARDFRSTLANVHADARRLQETHPTPKSDIPALDLENTGRILSSDSGFLQAISHARLVEIATQSDAVIRLVHRPGHFIVEGQTLAIVVPASAVTAVSTELNAAHIVGPRRTLAQDPGFAIDQLVEVATRALSPATNDTYTALNCIDWLGDCLCRVFREPFPAGIYHDASGKVRLIEPGITPDRLVKGATDMIRQTGRGIPAVVIRQLENLEKVLDGPLTPAQRALILHHAELILSASESSVPDEADRRDIRAAYDRLATVEQELRLG